MTGPKKPNLPPQVLNKLTRSNQATVAELQGPGPFRLPPLTSVEGLSGPDSQGLILLELETERAQGVEILLTEEAASHLRDLLGTYFAKQAAEASKAKKS